MGTFLWNIIEKIVRSVFGFIFKILGKELSEEGWESLFQFVKFGLIGALNTVLSYLIIVSLIFLLHKTPMQDDMCKYVANVIAFIITVFISFMLNRKFVFTLEEGEERSFFKSLLKCYASYFTTGILLNTILLYFWVDVCHISEYIAPLLNLILSVPINFILNKLWAFKSEEKTAG